MPDIATSARCHGLSEPPALHAPSAPRQRRANLIVEHDARARPRGYVPGAGPTLRAPDIHLEVLATDAVDGVEPPVTERYLFEKVARLLSWEE